MSLWTTVPASRFGVGKLWLPDLSFKLLYRDYALFARPFDMHVAEVTGNAGPTAGFTAKGSFTLKFPSSWDADVNLGAGTLSATVRLAAQQTSGAGEFIRLYDATANITSNQVALGGTYDYSDLTLTYDASAGVTIPTGDRTINVQISGTPGDGFKYKRTYGEDGVSCRMVWSA